MSRYKRPNYDDIHGFVERVEDVLLSESSWSTSDSDCSGCMHLSKESLHSDDALVTNVLPDEAPNSLDSSPQRAPLVPVASTSVTSSNRKDKQRNYKNHRHSKHKHVTGSGVRGSLGSSLLNLGRSTGSYFNSLPSNKTRVSQSAVPAFNSNPRSHSSFASHITASGVKCTADNSVPLKHRGKMLQQRSLLAAGAQPWNVNICSSHGRRFAYAATLVIYVYEVEEGSSDWQLCSILADHRKVITSLDWHPHNVDLIASSSEDQRVCVWSVSRQQVVCAISLCRPPMLVRWCSLTIQKDVVSFCTASGPIQLWDCNEGSEPMAYRENHPYSKGLRLYKWHPSIPGRLVVAHGDAKITIYREDSGHVKSNWCPEADMGGGELASGEIMGLEWADCSPDYLLVSYSSCKLWLLDITAFTVVTAFVLPAAVSIVTMAWLPDAPGMFVTGDSGKGVLRVWTVGKSTPLQSYVLKDTGFHELCATRCHVATSSSSRSSSSTPSFVHHQSHEVGKRDSNIAIPAVPVLCLFKDGGVGLYHLHRKHWVFNREHGHTETIFDCCFKPDDSDILATASFDGSIKIWRVDTLETVETLPNCRSIIYSVSWAPADLNCIAASTNDGRVFIWNISKHKIIQDFPGHKKSKVYCVTWNQNDSRRIASVGESCLCLVYEVSGQQLQAYQHPEPVYGCDWRNADTLATGCNDGKIRVFTVTSPKQEPSVILKAHSKKVFKVQWNPVYSDILCSGSDDTTVRLWAVSKAQCLAVLVGHTDNVRGLAWCPEIPYLLVSGAWDRSIRVWDAKTAKCLDVVLDHGADIYGLSIHPIRPFLLASCSRDSTVRLWSLTSFVSSLHLKVLANNPLPDILASTDGTSDVSTSLTSIPDQLCGLRARHLLAAIKQTEAHSLSPAATAQSAQSGKLLRLTADIFSADVHIRNLWDLVSVLTGQNDVSGLSPQYTSSIVHHSHLTKCDMAAAEQDYQKSLGLKVLSLRRSAQQDTALNDVAQRYLRCGAMRQYCDIMVKRGLWDHALAVAPSVSLDYWRQLTARYSEMLLAEDSDQCIPYLVACRDLDKLVEFHIARGNVKAAFSACVALDRFSRPKVSALPELPPRPSTLADQGLLSPPAVRDDRQVECATLLADWYLKRGSPVLSCCAMLASDHLKGALEYLLRGHELELVLAVGRLLLSSRAKCAGLAPLVDCGLRYLCYRAIRLGLRQVALDLAKTHSKGIDAQVLVCEVLLATGTPSQDGVALFTDAAAITGAQGGETQESVNSPLSDVGTPLAEQNSVGDEDEVKSEAPPRGQADDDDTSGNNSSLVVSSVARLLLAAQIKEGVTTALDFVVDQLSAGHLDDPSLWRVVQLLQSVVHHCSLQSTALDGHNSSTTTAATTECGLPKEMLGAIMTVSAATGAVKAGVLGYKPVVQHLIAMARLYIDKFKPLHSDVLTSFTRSLQARWDESCSNRAASTSGALAVNVGSAVRGCWSDSGLTRVTGSHLPRHSDAHTCCLTRAVIRGPSFTLENGESVLGLNEALMWAKVHPFSPLGTLHRLNPF